MTRTGFRPSPLFLGILTAAVIGGVLTAMDSTTVMRAGTLLLVLGGWGVSLCLHEFSHAAVAYRGGDRSVRAKGYLTLDPRNYADPLFSLVLPLLFVLIGGIPLPGAAVWVNHHALRGKRVESMVSLAGPLSNLVIGVLLTIVVGAVFPSVDTFGLPSPLAAGLSFLALLQMLAFLLNILPIPGLDGWGTIEPYLSPQAQRFGVAVRQWAPLALFAVLIAIHPVGDLFYSLAQRIFEAVGGNVVAAQFGGLNFFFWKY